MSTTDHNAEDDGRPTAAEYVLGVLSADERRTIEARSRHDAALARDIEYWEGRLGGLADDVAAVRPPSAMWSRIEDSLGGGAAPITAGLWQNLTFWRNFGVASATLAAASMAALAYIGLTPAPQRFPLMATLGQDGGQPGFVAAVPSDGTSVTIIPASLLAANQRAYELWLIPAGGTPHSLGLVTPGKPVRLDVPRALAEHMRSGGVLAISEEPPGGSPTGQPTGPVLAQGNLTRL